MAEIEFSTDQMRGMIGLKVHYHRSVYQIIEILEDGPHLVLESMEQHVSIQPDQHGEAHRKVPETCTIRILSLDNLEFSGDFLALIPLD